MIHIWRDHNNYFFTLPWNPIPKINNSIREKKRSLDPLQCIYCITQYCTMLDRIAAISFISKTDGCWLLQKSKQSCTVPHIRHVLDNHSSLRWMIWQLFSMVQHSAMQKVQCKRSWIEDKKGDTCLIFDSEDFLVIKQAMMSLNTYSNGFFEGKLNIRV